MGVGNTGFFNFGTKPGGSGFSFNFGNNGPFAQQASQRKGSDLVYELPLTLREVGMGTNKSVNFQHKGRTENLSVNIPAGMTTGKKLRLSGKGESSPHGGPPGDLFIQAKVLDDPLFSLEGYDLHVNREIKLTDAILGANILVPTVEGKELSLKIPPGTKHKTKMRFSGYGIPRMQGSGRGDLYVIIHVAMPAEISEQQRSLIGKLAETGL